MGEYLIEFVRLGNQVKVTACDPETGLEAVIMGPVHAGKKSLTDLAIKKLHYIQNRKAED